MILFAKRLKTATFGFHRSAYSKGDMGRLEAYTEDVCVDLKVPVAKPTCKKAPKTVT